MRTEVRVSPKVEEFVKSLAPEPRRAIRKGIKGLSQGRGDIKALEGKLSDWNRLRVGGYRVLFKETSEPGIRVLNCVFAQRRSVVYEMFAELLADELAG
jgi:mRNA-degrading endonuclease RelE of RelBE toxin-antitoxin system